VLVKALSRADVMLDKIPDSDASWWAVVNILKIAVPELRIEMEGDKVSKVELTGKDGGPVSFENKNDDIDEIRRTLITAIARTRERNQLEEHNQ
jgi:hypothetical protein